MVDHENFLREPARGKQTFRDEVHAIQCILFLYIYYLLLFLTLSLSIYFILLFSLSDIALHMLALCNTLIASDYNVHDILPFTDTAKLLALSVTNTLESIRHQLEMPRSHRYGETRGWREKRGKRENRESELKNEKVTK